MAASQQLKRNLSYTIQPFRTYTYSRSELNAFITPPEQKLEIDHDEAHHANPSNQNTVTSDADPISNHLVSFKDNIVTRHQLTTCGSRILKDHQSPFTAEVARTLMHSKKNVPSSLVKFENAGKTNLDEFGMGSHSQNSFFGPVKHHPPHSHISPGGSSGGSAIAVATDQVKLALGTDTGGSVRLPAAYTNIIGFKPSYGRYSRWGVIPYANSLDTVGLLSKSFPVLEEADSILDVSDPRDPSSLPSSFRERQRHVLGKERTRYFQKQLHYKLGVPKEYSVEELDEGVRVAWSKFLDDCQGMGHKIVPISLPHTKHALSAYYVLAAAESASNLSKYDGVRYGTRSSSVDGAGCALYSETRGQGFGDEVKRRILLGSYTLSSGAINNHFVKAQKVRRLVQQDFDRVFAEHNPLRDHAQYDLSTMSENVKLEDKSGPPQVDFIICPAAPTLPPAIKGLENQSLVDTYLNDVFTVPASLAGLPAMTIPVYIPDEYRQAREMAPHGTGIQVIGQFWDDRRVRLFTSSILKGMTEILKS